MTILEVTAVPFDANHRGGGESYVWRLSRELSRTEEVISCYSYESTAPSTAVPFRRIPARFLEAAPFLTRHNPLPTWRSLRSIVEQLRAGEEGPEFVHVHNLRTAMSTTWLLLTRLRRANARFKVLLTDHAARWFPVPRLTAAAADYFVPVSEASRSYLTRLADRPSFMLPPGVPTDYPGLGREPPSYESRNFDLAFFGRIVPWKRPDLALRLAHDLAPRIGRIPRVLIAGSAQEPGFLAWLRRDAERRAIGGSTTFAVDPADDEVPALLSNSKLHLFLSARVDVFGRRYPMPELAPATILEAAACGTPSICSDLPGVREQVLPDRTGLVYSVDDWAHIVDAATLLLGDPKRWKGLSDGAQGFVRSERTYRVLAGRFSGFLQNIREGRQ